jgi:uncharacterized membrane protein (DUF106 family)
VLVEGCHGGMFDQNTIRVLTSFHIVFPTFDLYFRHVRSDRFKGYIVMIICAIVLSTIIKRVLFLFVDLVSGHR